MAKRRRPHSEVAAEDNFWPSFADLTSTFVMILFVLVLLAYLQNLVFGRRLEATQGALVTTKGDLQRSLADVRAAQARLGVLRQEVERTSAEVSAGRLALAASAEKLSQQELVITQSQADLAGLQTKLQGIALLRVDVLEKVKSALERGLAAEQGRPTPLLSISNSGNIVIHENLVFEYNSYTIKDEGKPILRRLAAAFLAVLSDAEVRDNIDVVMIQGHTDLRGSMAFNRDLSAKRATAVLDFIFAQEPVLERDYARFFTAAAYSKSRPIAQAMAESEQERNRRIEVALVLTDHHVRKVIDEYMKSVRVPGEPVPVPTGAAAAEPSRQPTRADDSPTLDRLPDPTPDQD